MKTKPLSKILLSLGLAFVLVSAIPQVRGGSEASAAYAASSEDVKLPVVLSIAPIMSPGGKPVRSSST